MKYRLDAANEKIKAFDIAVEYQEELQMFDRKKFKNDYDKYRERLKAVQMEAGNALG